MRYRIKQNILSRSNVNADFFFGIIFHFTNNIIKITLLGSINASKILSTLFHCSILSILIFDEKNEHSVKMFGE